MGNLGEGLGQEMQRGAQENLWPKFILKSAPLRATSSVLEYSTLPANFKHLKIRDQQNSCR